MTHYKDNLYVDTFGRIYERYVLSKVSISTYGYSFTGKYVA